MTSEYTKIHSCIVSTLLYGSESWTLRTRQERRINAFHMRQILHITWQDEITKQQCLGESWYRQYRELAQGKRSTGRP